MSRSKRRSLGVLLLALVIGVLAAVPAAASSGSRRATKEPVSWWWNASAGGRSILVRTPAGLRATFVGSGLTPGDAVTLWVIIFNNPEACSTDPCSVPADVFAADTGADFYWADGRVVGRTGRAAFVGSVAVGQTAHSGKVEIGAGPAVPLTNPTGAEVVLALHSHGPASTGSTLDAQLSSFTGGCLVFNGVDGFATGPTDLPDSPGECATIQRSNHS